MPGYSERRTAASRRETGRHRPGAGRGPPRSTFSSGSGTSPPRWRPWPGGVLSSRRSWRRVTFGLGGRSCRRGGRGWLRQTAEARVVTPRTLETQRRRRRIPSGPLPIWGRSSEAVAGRRGGVRGTGRADQRVVVRHRDRMLGPGADAEDADRGTLGWAWRGWRPTTDFGLVGAAAGRIATTCAWTGRGGQTVGPVGDGTGRAGHRAGRPTGSWRGRAGQRRRAAGADPTTRGGSRRRGRSACVVAALQRPPPAPSASRAAPARRTGPHTPASRGSARRREHAVERCCPERESRARARDESPPSSIGDRGNSRSTDTSGPQPPTSTGGGSRSPRTSGFHAPLDRPGSRAGSGRRGSTARTPSRRGRARRALLQAGLQRRAASPRSAGRRRPRSGQRPAGPPGQRRGRTAADHRRGVRSRPCPPPTAGPPAALPDRAAAPGRGAGPARRSKREAWRGHADDRRMISRTTPTRSRRIRGRGGGCSRGGVAGEDRGQPVDGLEETMSHDHGQDADHDEHHAATGGPPPLAKTVRAKPGGTTGEESRPEFRACTPWPGTQPRPDVNRARRFLRSHR